MTTDDLLSFTKRQKLLSVGFTTLVLIGLIGFAYVYIPAFSAALHDGQSSDSVGTITAKEPTSDQPATITYPLATLTYNQTAAELRTELKPEDGNHHIYITKHANNTTRTYTKTDFENGQNTPTDASYLTKDSNLYYTQLYTQNTFTNTITKQLNLVDEQYILPITKTPIFEIRDTNGDIVLEDDFDEATFEQVGTTTRNGNELAVFVQTRDKDGNLLIDQSPHKILVDFDTQTYYYYGDNEDTTFEYTSKTTSPPQPNFVSNTNWTNTTPATQPPVKYNTQINSDTIALEFTWINSQQPYKFIIYNGDFSSPPQPDSLPTKTELRKPSPTHTHFGLINQPQKITLYPLNSTDNSQTGTLETQLGVNDSITIKNKNHTLFKSPYQFGEIYQINNIPTGTYTITISNQNTNTTRTYKNISITANETTHLDE